MLCLIDTGNRPDLSWMETEEEMTGRWEGGNWEEGQGGEDGEGG